MRVLQDPIRRSIVAFSWQPSARRVPGSVGLLVWGLLITGSLHAESAAVRHKPARAEERASADNSTGKTQSVVARKPLRHRVDQVIAARLAERLPALTAADVVPADDAELIRRATLDLWGVIPVADDVTDYLADNDSRKYQRLIDRLLTDPRHHHHLAAKLGITWMERRPDKHVSAADWTKWLTAQIADNRPLDDTVRDLLSADGSDADTRPAAKFLLDRNLDKDIVTRDIGRLFLGRDLECAQCHDHPLYDEYLQRHYFGITAFLNRSYVFNDKKKKRSIIAEKAVGVVKFASVFTNESGETPPRILNLAGIPDPPADKNPYVAKPTSAVAGVPKYSRRKLLATAVTDPANTAFRQNMANRLWAFVMGRGLVEPVDLWHVDNPPSHPELARLLGEELHRSGYNVQQFLRELLLSETYRRGSRVRAGVPVPADEHFAISVLRPLTPEQLTDSAFMAIGLTESTLQRVIAARKSKQPAIEHDVALQQAALRSEMNKLRAPFLKAFVDGPPTSRFDATAQQALFLKNGGLMATSLAPRSDNIIGRLQKQHEVDEIASTLYLSILSRPATSGEIEQIREYLREDDAELSTAERTLRLQELTWALLTSAEFRLQH